MVHQGTYVMTLSGLLIVAVGLFLMALAIIPEIHQPIAPFSI